MFRKFSNLNEIGPEKSEWSICVRAQAIWKGINRKTNEFRGYNILFVDDQSCRIHGFISDKIAELFEKDLKEGVVYLLSNFKVKIYDGAEINRAVRNQKHIYFDGQTKLVALSESDCKVPNDSFDLFSLEYAEKMLTDNRILVDVIGVVDTANPSCLTSKDDIIKPHMKFVITDGRLKLNVTFFNEFAQMFEKAFKEVKGGEVVIIIASAKVNKYEGEVYLTNYPATRVYVNPNHYSAQLLKRSMSTVKCSEECDITKYTIDQIKNLKESYIQKDVLCHLKVKKVEEQYNWYENLCTGYGEEINKVDGRYRCAVKCKRNIPWPEKRFRICTVCCDSSGIMAVIFPDDEVQRITDKDAFEIENDEGQVGIDGTAFPPLLKQFENQEYNVVLTVSEDNVKKGCKIYHAKQLGDPREKLENHDPFTREVGEVQELTIKNDSPTNVIPETGSPPTMTSSNKNRGRPVEESLKFEINENSPATKLRKTLNCQ